MSEKKILKLNKYADKCRVITSAKVYESDKEVADSIKKACDMRKTNTNQMKCTFGVRVRA